MPVTPINAATARSAQNLTVEGREVMWRLKSAFGTLPAGTWIVAGLFPPDAKISVTTDVTRTEVLAQNPEGGAPIQLTEDVTGVSAVYDSIPVLTPDETVRMLHAGAVPVPLTGALEGGTISPFEVGASIPVTQVVIRRHKGAAADRLFKVYVHFTVGLQANGEGDSQGKETLDFRAPVQAFDKNLLEADSALAAFKPQIGDLGAVFTIPANKLQALLDAIDDALPTVA